MDEEKNFFDKMVGKTQPLTSLTTQTTNIVLTDPPGSVIATFSATAGSAALSGNKALASVDGPDLYIATSQEQLIEILDYLGDAP
jgi:hypothetical protein